MNKFVKFFLCVVLASSVTTVQSSVISSAWDLARGTASKAGSVASTVYNKTGASTVVNGTANITKKVADKTGVTAAANKLGSGISYMGKKMGFDPTQAMHFSEGDAINATPLLLASIPQMVALALSGGMAAPFLAPAIMMTWSPFLLKKLLEAFGLQNTPIHMIDNVQAKGAHCLMVSSPSIIMAMGTAAIKTFFSAAPASSAVATAGSAAATAGAATATSTAIVAAGISMAIAKCAGPMLVQMEKDGIKMVQGGLDTVGLDFDIGQAVAPIAQTINPILEDVIGTVIKAGMKENMASYNKEQARQEKNKSSQATQFDGSGVQTDDDYFLIAPKRAAKNTSEIEEHFEDSFMQNLDDQQEEDVWHDASESKDEDVWHDASEDLNEGLFSSLRSKIFTPNVSAG